MNILFMFAYMCRILLFIIVFSGFFLFYICFDFVIGTNANDCPEIFILKLYALACSLIKQQNVSERLLKSRVNI